MTQQDQNSSGDGALKSQVLSDGFGRAVESDSFETASQYVATTKQYDAMGRVWQTTNPSRPGDNLNAPTTYTFDSLGRVTQIQTADGAATHISYWGNAQWVTDPAGKMRQYTYDALGRLINVKEDPNGVNFTTDYRRILPCQGGARRLLLRPREAPPDPILIPAINPVTGVVAVACNMALHPSIVLLDSDLKLKIRNWTVPMAVQDLRWSSNGKMLAVLSFTPPYPWDKNGKFEASLADAPPKEPNLLIFNAQNGNLIERFRTGGFDGQIAYSPDGSLIYSISHAKYLGYSRGDWAKENIRALDSKTGRLVRTFDVPKTGVRNNFSLSSDGKLIAAQSTVDAWVPWPFSEPGESGTVNAGFVILDTHTGRMIFRTEHRVGGDVRNRIPIFWGPKGRNLFVQFGAPIREYSISSATDRKK